MSLDNDACAWKVIVLYLSRNTWGLTYEASTISISSSRRGFKVTPEQSLPSRRSGLFARTGFANSARDRRELCVQTNFTAGCRRRDQAVVAVESISDDLWRLYSVRLNDGRV